jgi:glycosyltransferase involved in cell wall biosynthesis
MISVCILTKNSAATLKATLDSTAHFPEVLLLDNGSTDETLTIAATYPNVCIHQSPFIGFGPLRNRAASLAAHDWILALDSDEVLSPPLQREIAQISLNPQCAYRIPRHNFYNQKRIRGCGWDPESVCRLYHRKATAFSSAQVHESLLTHNLTILPLKHPLLHTPYRSVADFLTKMQHYSTLFAEQNQHRKDASLPKAMGHALFAFFKTYLIKRGWMCGAEGFFISFYNAHTAFYKYMKLRELNKEPTDVGSLKNGEQRN